MNIRQYRYLHHGDNEWLADTESNSNDEEWQEAWEALKQEADGIKIEFSEDIYSSSEYDGGPEWINVTIKDETILQYKMARGIIKSLNGAHSIVFFAGIDCYTSDDFQIGHEEIAITEGGAYVTLRAKHSSDEIELNITEQFNQAIGE